MSEMIERVAQAMVAELRRQDGHLWVSRRPDALTDFPVDGDVDLVALSRAAIEAMREPTEAMRVAAQVSADPWLKTWPILIDAALK